VRIQTFTAKTLNQAMADVRRSLGTVAVILQVEEATRKNPARVVAAIEPTHAQSRADSIVDDVPENTAETIAAKIAQLCAFHGVVADVQAKLQTTVAAFDTDDLESALTQALELMMSFRPIALRVQTSLMLIGQPGQGKSLTAARLAVAAKAQGRNVRIITLDASSAGAMSQLQTFCTPLSIPVQEMTADELAHTDTTQSDTFSIIDTGGFNPYALDDITMMTQLLARTRIEPVWVSSCGIDTQELTEQAQIFSALGAQRLIATRADTCRRFGALLTIICQHRIALAGLSDSPYISEPLRNGSAAQLAEKLFADPRMTQTKTNTTDVRSAA
jgi:flagellar biosynthesis protein FlhF